MRSPFAVIASHERSMSWALKKALVLQVAEQAESWRAAGMLADALGIEPPDQEAIYREAEQTRARAAQERRAERRRLEQELAALRVERERVEADTADIRSIIGSEQTGGGVGRDTAPPPAVAF